MLSEIWEIAFSKDSTEFGQLSHQDLKMLLKHDKLNLPRGEAQVAEIIAKWAKGDQEGRKSSATEMIDELVRFGLVLPQEDKDLKNAALGISDEAYSIVKVYLRSLRDQNHPCTLELKNFRPRIPTDLIFAIGGWSSGRPTNRVEVYDSKVNRWFECPSIDNAPRAYHGVAAMDGHIFVIAGYDSIEYFSSSRKFDPSSRTWSQIANMTTQRCYVNSAVLRGQIYAVGGYDGQQRHNTVERYDPKSNQWTMIQPMIFIRSDCSAAALGDYLYVAGGFDGQVVTDTMERYDPGTDSWSMMREMHTRRSGVSMAAHDGFLYVLGGFDGQHRLDSVERYNPQTNTWHRLQPMNTRRSNFSAAVLHDFIYVAGGYNGFTTIPDVERYDIKNNKWEPVARMIADRSALKLCVLHNENNPESYTFHGNPHVVDPVAAVANRAVLPF